MIDSLKGKCAVITGGGRGQGREIALAMASHGVSVVVNDLGGATDGTGADRAPADEVVAEIQRGGGTGVADYHSVADFAGAGEMIDLCVRTFGQIDILVNCAGVGGKRPSHFWETTKDDWDAVIGVNLNGTFNTCRHALGHMVARKKGRIINFSSPSWLGNGASAYTASKGAVVSLTMGIAQMTAVEGYDITCNALVPIADTRMSPKRGREMWERLYRAGLISRQIFEESCNPPGPEHVPGIVLYLASDESRKINGQVLGASRGRVALYSWPTEAKGLYKDGVWTPEELVELMPMTLEQEMRTARG